MTEPVVYEVKVLYELPTDSADGAIGRVFREITTAAGDQQPSACAGTFLAGQEMKGVLTWTCESAEEALRIKDAVMGLPHVKEVTLETKPCQQPKD